MVMKAALCVSIPICGLSAADVLGSQGCDHLLSRQQATILFRFPTKEDTTKDQNCSLEADRLQSVSCAAAYVVKAFDSAGCCCQQ